MKWGKKNHFCHFSPRLLSQQCFLWVCHWDVELDSNPDPGKSSAHTHTHTQSSALSLDRAPLHLKMQGKFWGCKRSTNLQRDGVHTNYVWFSAASRAARDPITRRLSHLACFCVCVCLCAHFGVASLNSRTPLNAHLPRSVQDLGSLFDHVQVETLQD